ncbi:MAG: hypothetical protein WBB62_16270 [Rhodococcus sp. (in: high G+C Gram-positive bacteria)]
MNWVGRELSVASLLGAGTGVVVMWPTLLAGSWGALWLAVVFGGPTGLLVGFAAVGGGKYAQRLDLWWPARSAQRWRHRFAGCSAAAVMLLAAAAMGWTIALSFNLSAGGDPIPWIVLTVTVVVSYLGSYLLAPAQLRETLTPAADPTAPTTPPTSAVADPSRVLTRK